MSDDRRVVPLDGCANFRDLGGYRTGDGRQLRWSRVYRSDGLHELSTADIRRLRQELGLRAIIDLRTPDEAGVEGPGSLADEPVRYHHVSLMNDARGTARRLPPGETFSMDRFYTAMLRDGMPQVRRVVELIAHAEGPAVFHCAAGKDRTGVIAAVVLSLVGVDETQIVADYALSQRAVEGIRARLLRSRGYERMWNELPPETLHAHPETMQRTLDGVRESWGSMQDYAVAAGIDADLTARLRDGLLEPV